MMKFFLMLSLLLSVLGASDTRAQNVRDDEANRKALEDTQKLLRDRIQREQAIQGSEPAQKANQEAQTLGGSAQNADQIYSLSAEIFANIVKQSNGDAAKMQQMINDAALHPEKLDLFMTPEIRQQLKGLANEIERQRKPATP